jgi:hypothetical protein
MNPQMLDFYHQQSEITEPGTYGHYFDDLPHDIAGLVKVVRHLYNQSEYGKTVQRQLAAIQAGEQL